MSSVGQLIGVHWDMKSHTGGLMTLGKGTIYGTSCKQNLFAVVEFWELLPLIIFFNTSTGWFGRFVLSTECYRTRKLDYKDLNWPRCSAWVTESLVLTDGGFCQKQTLYILDYVNIVSL